MGHHGDAHVAHGHDGRPGRVTGGGLETTVSAATATPGEQNAPAPPGWPGWRRLLGVTGLVLVLACLLPPLDMLGRRYVFAESLQFCVFAMAGPALIVLGAPWRFLRLSRAGSGPRGPGPADRLAAARRDNRSFGRATVFLIAFIAVCLAWRLPSVMDALARQPALVVPEALTLLAAGAGLWLELVDSPPVAPRLPRPGRAAVAALAMWSTWAVAYVLGFASHAIFHGYDAAGSGLSAVADQEIAVGLVWAVAGLCFVPVVITSMLGWMGGGEDADEEFQRVFRDENQRATVRGWGPRPRRRPPSSA
jgi:cytochrome c oxidase assembly factor CtaG